LLLALLLPGLQVGRPVDLLLLLLLLLLVV
jgi:hypothetical protein